MNFIPKKCRPEEVDVDQRGAFARTIKMRPRKSEHEQEHASLI
jgi:hypothetical protein